MARKLSKSLRRRKIKKSKIKKSKRKKSKIKKSKRKKSKRKKSKRSSAPCSPPVAERVRDTNLIPYKDICRIMGSNNLPGEFRPWRFIENSSANDYAYDPKGNKWIYVGNKNKKKKKPSFIVLRGIVNVKKMNKLIKRKSRRKLRRKSRRRKKFNMDTAGCNMSCTTAANMVAGLQGLIDPSSGALGPPRKNIVVDIDGINPRIGGAAAVAENFVSNGFLEHPWQYSHRDTEINDFFTTVPDNLFVFTFTPPNSKLWCYGVPGVPAAVGNDISYISAMLQEMQRQDREERAHHWTARQLAFLANPNWILANHAEFTSVAKLYMPGNIIYNQLYRWSVEKGVGFYEQHPEGFVPVEHVNHELENMFPPENPGSTGLPIYTLAYILGEISKNYKETEAAEGRDSSNSPLAVYLTTCNPPIRDNFPIAPVLRLIEKKRKTSAVAARRRFEDFRDTVKDCDILFMMPFRIPGFGATPSSWETVFTVTTGRGTPSPNLLKELSSVLIPPKDRLLNCTKYHSERSCENLTGSSYNPSRVAGDNECVWLPEWINDTHPTEPPSQCREIGKGHRFEAYPLSLKTKNILDQGDLHYRVGQLAARKARS